MGREQIKQLYEAISTGFFLGDEIFEIGNKRYEPVALFGLLTLILNGRELIFGEYGSGKTTSSERISSLFLGLPLEFVQTATIHGHPEQTEEKIKATLDLAVLEKEGREVVKWKVAPFSPVITIDEINRLPVGKQSTILNEVDRNIWNYRGETLIFKSDKTFFATINYQDTGATTLIPPLLDRFDIAVETGRLHPVRKRFVRRGVDDRILQEKKLSQTMIDYILENSLTENADKLIEYVNECREKFRGEIEERFKSRGIELSIPVKEEIDCIREEISKIDISEDAELFLDYVGQEVYCQLSLKKDFSKCNGCHYANYICSDLFGISNRAERSIINYSKALAWLENKEVELEHLIAVMPYAIWHRSTINDEVIGRVRDFEKDSCDEFYAMNEILGSVKRRWVEHREFQIKAYIHIKNGEYSKAKEIAENINHPFFRGLVRGL